MSRELLVRKLAHLRRLLEDLRAFERASQAEVEAHHYTVERILELLVVVASDLLFHMLAERGRSPGSYREAFKMAGQEGLLSSELSERLQRAAGMRSILVHLYDKIDYAVVHQSIGPFLNDFSRFIAEAEQWKTEAD